MLTLMCMVVMNSDKGFYAVVVVVVVVVVIIIFKWLIG